MKTYFHHRIVNFQDIHLKFLYVVDNLIKIWYELFPELFWTSLFREGEIFEQKSMKIAFLMVFLCGKHNIVQNALISECIELWKSLTTLTTTIEVIQPNFTNLYKEISVHNRKNVSTFNTTLKTGLNYHALKNVFVHKTFIFAWNLLKFCILSHIWILEGL